MPRLPHGGVLGLGSGKLVSRLVSSPQDSTNNVSHSTASVRTQDLDGNEVGCLGNTVLARTDGTSTVGPVAIAVLIDIIRDGHAPGRATLKLRMMDVDAGIDNLGVDTLTAGRVVLVASEGSETEFPTMGDTRKTLDVTSLPMTRQEQDQGTYPWSKALSI